MSFFRKLFGSKKSKQRPLKKEPAHPNPVPAEPSPAKPDTAAKASPGPSNDNELITVYDQFGREMRLTREQWLNNVLLDNLKKHWEQPDELANLLVNAFQDGFFAEVQDAAEQLYAIDHNKHRSATLLAIVYMRTGDPRSAESLLTKHIAKHGEEGVVLTNLAKAKADLGKKDDSMQTLWRALELDPNQDNGLGWYEIEIKESKGAETARQALEKVAALPGSWRAHLWLARQQLSAGDLDAAMSLYRESLERSENPKPADQLVQISGDLGNGGHLPQILELVEPHFDPLTHGLQVGNNLIKANLDLGQLETVRKILDRLQLMQRPDWNEHLGFWEHELAKTRNETSKQPAGAQDINLTLVTFEGPLWIGRENPYASLFPPKPKESPVVVFQGCSIARPQIGESTQYQLSDNPGRFSRVLPMWLAETVHLNSNAVCYAVIPWNQAQNGSFVVFGAEASDDAVAHQARMDFGSAFDRPTADYAVYTHLEIQGENWTAHYRVIRTIDAKRIAEFSHPFAEGAYRQVHQRALDELRALLANEVGVQWQPNELPVNPPMEWLDHYLFRLEQCLAVRCSLMAEGEESNLSNIPEIIQGSLQYCLDAPEHLSGRLMLLHTLEGIKRQRPELVASFTEKVRKLWSQQPITQVEATEINRQLEKVLG